MWGSYEPHRYRHRPDPHQRLGERPRGRHAGPSHSRQPVHGKVLSRRCRSRLPRDARVVAPDLRGFGRTEAKPIDATRGLDEWIEDVEALVKKIGWSGRKLHVGGWSLGGGIAMGYAAKHPGDVASLTLVAPMSPYGFGATRDAAGTPTTSDFAGSGGGAVNPEFLRRIAAGDMSSDEPMSSPRVTMTSFFWSPKYKAPRTRMTFLPRYC